MKWMIGCIGLAACFSVRLLADMVELQDGTRVEGTILAENPDSIEIEIGTNPAGTIRRVLIIDSREIRTWESDRPPQVMGDTPQAAVNHLSGIAYVEDLLKKAQASIDRRDVDGGIRQYAEAAQVAGRDVRDLSPEDQAEMLGLKVYATKLQKVALEGKEEALERELDRLEDRLKELEDQEESLLADIEEYREEKEEIVTGVSEDRAKKFGSKQKLDELRLREQALLARQSELKRLRLQREQAREQTHQNLQKTKLQIELVEEQVDRAEDEAKQAEKSIRRR